ncbi:MAG: hypothetical protein R6V07_03650 [Armatimonadota bacterium]
MLIAILVCVTFAYAQDNGGGDRGFFIESIAQESVVPGDVDAPGNAALVEDLNDYEFDLELPSGLSLYRNFNRREIDRKNLIFNTGISEDSSTGATLTLGSRTQMSFSREESSVTDIFQQLLESETTTTMSLQQGFGGGDTSGQFTFARSLQNEQGEDGEELDTLTQRFGVDTGLGMGMQLTGGYYTREAQESAFRLQETGWNADLRMSLSGGEGRAHYDYLTRMAEGRRTNKKVIDLVAPFAVQGGTLSAEYHLTEARTGDRTNIDRKTGFAMPLDMVFGGGQASFLETTQIRGNKEKRDRETNVELPLSMLVEGAEASYFETVAINNDKRKVDRETSVVMPLSMLVDGAQASYLETVAVKNNNEKIDRETRIVMPLDMLIDGAEASYLELTQIRNDNRQEKNILNLMTPFRAFGHDATLQHTETEMVKNERSVDESVTRLAATFDGSQGFIERTRTVESRGEDLEHRARLRMQTPDIGLSEWANLTASQVRDEVEGEETSRVSRVDLSMEPFDPLEIHAIYTRHEAPGTETRADHDIKTALSLSDSALLKGAIREISREDGSPSLVRDFELTKRAGDTGVDMRLGFLSLGAQNEESDGEMLGQLNWDAGSSIGLSAFYTEFDEKKKKPLDDPTTTLELRAGDPASLGVRAGYSDHAGRDEPERTLGLATEAFGGGLKLGYIRNPLDPRGKSVMLSDVYELGFKRQVMGSVSMDLGYRYFMPRTGEALDNDHFFKLQLDGGNVNEGGQIALKYLSGHYVPYPKRHDPPASVLDLSYERRWPADEGRLTLSFSREEAPDLSVGVDDNFEAEVKYETVF